MLIFLENQDQKWRKVFKLIMAIFGHFGYENALFTIIRKFLLSVSIGIIRTIVTDFEGMKWGKIGFLEIFTPGVKKVKGRG